MNNTSLPHKFVWRQAVRICALGIVLPIFIINFVHILLFYAFQFSDAPYDIEDGAFVFVVMAIIPMTYGYFFLKTRDCVNKALPHHDDSRESFTPVS